MLPAQQQERKGCEDKRELKQQQFLLWKDYGVEEEAQF